MLMSFDYHISGCKVTHVNVWLGRPSKKFKAIEAFKELTFQKLDTFRKITKKELGLYPF